MPEDTRQPRNLPAPTQADFDAWMNAGHYLPDFMRDFHSQKDLFKMLEEVRERADAKAGGHRSTEAVTWSAAQIYTVDVFLYVLARHGYTLQRSRQRFGFRDIWNAVSGAKARRNAAMAQAMGLTPLNQ